MDVIIQAMARWEQERKYNCQSCELLLECSIITIVLPCNNRRRNEID